MALSLAVTFAAEEACSAFPRHWPNCCFLLSVGSSPGPRLSICLVYPLALHLSLWRGRREGNVLSCFTPCILPILPSSRPRTQPFLLPMLCSRTVVWCLILCPAPGPKFSLGLELAAITAHSGLPGRMQVGDFRGWPVGARLSVLRPTRGLGTTLPSDLCLELALQQ